MPETATARILPFPTRPEAPLTSAQAQVLAYGYLELRGEDRSTDRRAALLRSPEMLMSVCALLRERVESSAADVSTEAIALYRSISGSRQALGSFDERDYFLGEAALLAATASRILGKRSDAELWLDRAEAGFRHTVNPAPLLANVTYQRLALRCETGRYEEVIELAPMLSSSFAKLNMRREGGKCILLEGVALKQSGNHEAAIERLESLVESYLIEMDPALVGLALATLADIHVAAGRDQQAEASYGRAVPLMLRAKRPVTLAYLQSAIGDTLRRQGRLDESIRAYQSSIDGYEKLGMRSWVAYLRVVLAQAHIEAGQLREAEWQILAALPTIDEEKMVPEGFAAVALLRESVRQRKMDPLALRDLREHLQVKN